MVTQQPAERLDISDRDPDTITPIELLAWAYPDVYALMLERDAAAATLEHVRSIAADNRDRCEGCARILDTLPAAPEVG